MIARNHENQPAKAVLLVADNVQDTEDFSWWFRQVGFRVDIASNAIQAVSQARNEPYRLVLVNWQMNGELGGLETIWLLKTLVHDSKIVLLANHIDSSDEKRAASYGINHWIYKPFNSSRTPQEIEMILSEQAHTMTKPPRYRLFQQIKNRIQKINHHN